MTETWSYYDANTIEITGDLTTKYWVGQLIKITQTTDKFFAITAVNLVTGNTRLTINGGGVYTLVNAAITSHEFSNCASPKGVPLNFNKNINGNFAASTDPTTGDDTADGYIVGSPWVNTTDHKIFLCESPAAGAAVWRQIWPARAEDMNFQAGVYQQLLINGDFQINQQAVSEYTSSTNPANNDDTYAAPDQWLLLSDGNNVVKVSHQTGTWLGTAVKLTVATANKKFGLIQFVENVDASKYYNKAASLQFKAYTPSGNPLRTLRAAVLSWNGTADALTSDLVSAWNSEGSNPAWIANWTAENTPEDLALVADAWTTYRIENISIDTAGLTNLAVFIWCDDGDADVGDIVFISQVQLNLGPICLPYSQRSFQDELQKCMRFWQKTYAYETPIGTVTTVNDIIWFAHGGTGWSRVPVPWPVPLRKSLYPTGYSPGTGAANKVYNVNLGSDVNGNGEPSSWCCTYGVANVSVAEGSTLRVHCVADARL